MQADDYGSMHDDYNLPNQSTRGTAAQCAAVCTAARDCRGFSWRVGVSVSAAGACYLKSAIHPGKTQLKGIWTTYVIRCNAGMLLSPAMPWSKVCLRCA